MQWRDRLGRGNNWNGSERKHCFFKNQAEECLLGREFLGLGKENLQGKLLSRIKKNAL